MPMFEEQLIDYIENIIPQFHELSNEPSHDKLSEKRRATPMIKSNISLFKKKAASNNYEN